MDKIYELLKYLFLGFFQGLTEPIPISSSGHLLLAQYFLDLSIEGMSFELLVNAASLLAVLLIYRSDITRLTINGLRYIKTREEAARADFRFIIYLVIATIPAGVIGILYDDEIASFFKEGILLIGITLLITGIALWTIRNLRGRKNDAELKLTDAIIIGIAQAIALIPGISRSGATIVAAMGLGMKQETALRFSFLMFIPVSFGGLLLSLSDIVNDPDLNSLLIPYTVAFLGSLVASYFSLKWFMNIMAKGNLKYFAYYCFVVGGSIVLFNF
ncbi:undecaprenyl-diphosphate phosphatase [Cytobacillus sp. S13-E01]|uniref:undecaprenyl-diphosphate phosphatase n=1 Tax=Cytobacillus sp. S13-E01 TaxID=3031326 RepID=UPI0023D822B5|nr:undecaprenyl-diphosphate phosphatase [Cytobacillus sp. S13-E01]MDF0728597.1 undecaprenyl-diphosphate phosphatase [Cytobacillus sp. S13-E01]